MKRRARRDAKPHRFRKAGSRRGAVLRRTPYTGKPERSSEASCSGATTNDPIAAVSIPLPRAWWMELRDCCRVISEDRPTRQQHRHTLNRAAMGIGRVLANCGDDPQTITRQRKGWVRLATILANYGNKLDRLAWAAFRAIHEAVIGANAVK